MGVGEAALRLVDLQGRDPQVHQHALDRRQAEVCDHVADLVVDGVHGLEPVTEPREPPGGQRDGLRVTVDADHPCRRDLLQDGLRVPAHAERAVDQDRSRRHEGGGEEVDATLEEHRDVPVLCSRS
ncbi:hypothetical protein D3C74_360720 [compost metagenome]